MFKQRLLQINKIDLQLNIDRNKLIFRIYDTIFSCKNINNFTAKIPNLWYHFLSCLQAQDRKFSQFSKLVVNLGYTKQNFFKFRVTRGSKMNKCRIIPSKVEL